MKRFFYTAVFLFFTLPLNAQTSASSAGQAAPVQPAAREEQAQTLPAEYRGIQLGMNIDTVKELLKADSIFGYRGERDISLLLTENRSLIESAGSFFISRSWFQFYEDALYTMILKLNTDTVDYYSVYTAFCEKYGEPSSINPKRAVWEDQQTRIVIERPLIVKYIDLAVFNRLISGHTAEKAASELHRKQFIDGF